MASKLVIVESPAKAKTIAGYLGADFAVEASVGHIRDIPTPSEMPAEMKKEDKTAAAKKPAAAEAKKAEAKKP